MKPLIPQTVYVPQPYFEDSKITSSFKINCSMKEQEGYFFTKEELTKLITDTWDASADCIEDIMKHSKAVNYPNLPQFINNLLNQQ